jgi:chitin disaccharide deacetylase
MNRCSIRYAVTLMVAGALVGATERHASPAPVIRLIVQADDLGVAHGINVASIQAYTQGIVRSVNVIVPAPWTPEAVALLDQHPDLDAGVHLAITSEWSSIKWRPLTGAPSLVDARGYFLSMVWPNDRLPPKSSLKENAPVLTEIERELRAQIEFAKREIPQLTYTWNHMGFDSLAPEIRELTNKLTKEYGLVTPFDLGVQDIGHVYEGTDTGAVRATKLAARLEALGPGTWLMVDHAAVDTAETQALGHPGYENVAADRSAVLEAWTSSAVKDVIRRRGIALTNYRVLLDENKQP